MHLSFPKWFPLLYLFSFLCLQVSSVSNFLRLKEPKVITYLGLLVQLCCGEGGTLQTNITGMCGEFSQCLGHIGCPTHGHTFPVYSAQAPGCSAGELSKAGPGLCALPRSKPLRFGFLGTPQRCRFSWACVLCPSQVQAAQATRCLVSALSPGGEMSPIASPVPAAWFPRYTVSGVSCVSSGELICGCDPPGGCQSSRIPGSLG